MSCKSMIYVLTAMTVLCALQTLRLALCANEKKVDMHFFDDSFKGNLTVLAVHCLRVLHAGYFPMKGILWQLTDI
jgi:hypothetical protein